MTNLLKISITHNKKQIPLLNLLVHCISFRSVRQIFSINDERTFRFSKFLIIASGNFSANSWFERISL